MVLLQCPYDINTVSLWYYYSVPVVLLQCPYRIENRGSTFIIAFFISHAVIIINDRSICVVVIAIHTDRHRHSGVVVANQ